MSTDQPLDPRCASCGLRREARPCVAPGNDEPGHPPESCPMDNHPRVLEQATERLLADPELLRMARAASIQEGEGYADRQAVPYVKRPCKPRIQETWEFARRMGYRRVGLAFCIGLRAEAREVARLLELHGLEVVSAMCKAGAVPKEKLGLDDAHKVHPGGFEAMCHPVAQAELFNAAGTELNILLGLCVGHDSLFLGASRAPCTVLAAKDRVSAHNPLAAVYTSGSYYARLRDPGSDDGR